MDTTDVDVLIVGGGPTGLALANELKKHGVSRVRIVDKLQKQRLIAKASALQSRTLELFKTMPSHSDLNILELFERRSVLAQTALLQSYSSTNPEVRQTLLRVDFSQLRSPYNYMYLVEQWYTEQCLQEMLQKSYNVELERGIKAVSLHDDNTHVTVNLLDSASSETQQVRCKFVVGCDGAHSFVRKSLDCTFDGEAIPQLILLIHIKGVDEIGFDDKVVITSGENGFVFAVKMPEDSWLIIADVADRDLTEYKNRHGGETEVNPTAEDFGILLGERGFNSKKCKETFKQENILWTSRFRIQSRQSNNYSRGRVFLCGDACHIHSPVGGQGMNTGIQDSFNLGWKLALVCQGKCGMKLLDSYEDERFSVGKRVVEVTDRVSRLAFIRNFVFNAVRKNVVAVASSVQFILETQANTLGQTLYSYKKGPLAQETWIRPTVLRPLRRRDQNLHRFLRPRLMAGDRVPPISFIEKRDGEEVNIYFALRDTGGQSPPFVLLLFEGMPEWASSQLDEADLVAKSEEFSSKLGHWVRVFVVSRHDVRAHQMFGAVRQCMFLIRPDAYVGLRSEPIDFDALRYYLATRIHSVDVRSEKFRLGRTVDWVTVVFFQFFELLGQSSDLKTS